MNVIVRRLLVRGPFVFAATAGLAMGLGFLFESFMSNDQVKIERGDPWTGPLIFGGLGVAVYVCLELLASARERWKKPPVT